MAFVGWGSIENDAFGNILEETGGYNNPYRYSGYTYDEESDLYDLKARFYDAKIARFMQQDSYLGSQADPLSLNLYAYCNNNPIKYWDPTGHVTVTMPDGSSRDSAKGTAKIENGYTYVLQKNAWVRVPEGAVVYPNGSSGSAYLMLNGKGVSVKKTDVVLLPGTIAKKEINGYIITDPEHKNYHQTYVIYNNNLMLATQAATYGKVKTNAQANGGWVEWDYRPKVDPPSGGSGGTNNNSGGGTNNNSGGTNNNSGGTNTKPSQTGGTKTPSGGSSGYISPYKNGTPTITSLYGYRIKDGNTSVDNHFAFDIDGGHQSELVSIADGTVVYAGDNGNGYGYHVIIQYYDPDLGSFQVMYAHLDSITSGIEAGVSVKQGKTIGKQGNTGASYGTHLHFHAWYGTTITYARDNTSLNPLEVLYGIAMTPEAINKSGMFKMGTDYGWTINFLKKYEAGTLPQDKSMYDKTIIDSLYKLTERTRP